MSLFNCQYMLLPCWAQGNGKTISRGWRSAVYLRSVKNAGISMLLTQNEGRGFGAIDATIIAASANLVIGGAENAESHIAIITATTRNAYIMKRTGRMSSTRGSR